MTDSATSSPGAEFIAELKNEDDVTDQQSAVIGLYAFVLTALFFGTVFALFTYFQWELAHVEETRVKAAFDPTYEAIKTKAERGLAGTPTKIDDAVKVMATQGKALPKPKTTGN